MSTQNRLKLDWSLNTSLERQAFINQYIGQLINPTTDELETMANYVLWGKEADGTSAVQKKDLQIETRNKTWQRDDTESLDALIESPTFNEASLRKTSSMTSRKKHETFDRTAALQCCPPHMRETFEDLFKRIDLLELQVQWYEFDHQKRTEEPRRALQSRFNESDLWSARETASKWNQYKYLKSRHLLVELRREQFTLRDSFQNQLLSHTLPEPEAEPAHLDFEAEIPVYPLGLLGSQIAPLVFKPAEKLEPSSYTQDELKRVSHFYWSKNQQNHAPAALYFDFREVEHIYQLFGQMSEIEESIDELPIESNLGKLVNTLKYYIELTELSEAQQEILDLKIQKYKNQDIADCVNKKYEKTYTANYISTIFRQKIIPKIIDAVKLHQKIIENICFEENFKRCTGCGRVLLADPINYVRKTRSKDGLSTRCKQCDRNDRQKKKVN